MRIKRLLQFLVALMMVLPVYGQNNLLILLQKAEGGESHAQSTLGYLYAKGQGVQQDYLQAAYWWKKASSKGDADAQYNLGLLYESGDGVPQDRFKAVKSWRRAAEKGHAIAQWRMSICYTDGKWIKPKPSRAAHWQMLAMKSGYIGNLKQGQGDELNAPKGLRPQTPLSDSEPVFSMPSFGSSDFPIVTYNVEAEDSPEGIAVGTLAVDLNKSKNDRGKIRAKMIAKIEEACLSRTMFYVGETPPKEIGAAYKIKRESESDNILTIEFIVVK